MEKQKTDLEVIGEQPAFASVGYDALGGGYCQVGLTKREHFAAMAMQGLLAGNYSYFDGNANVPIPFSIAGEALAHADALITALNSPKP